MTLNEVGLAAAAYHGGMESDQRREVETRFQREDGLIVVATIALVSFALSVWLVQRAPAPMSG